MEIVKSEKYDDYAAELQYQMIKLLNESLKKHQLSDEIRKDICENFTFDFSMLLDQGNVLDSVPSVTFSAENKLFIKRDSFEFHEYVFGNVEELFEKEP